MYKRYFFPPTDFVILWINFEKLIMWFLYFLMALTKKLRQSLDKVVRSSIFSAYYWNYELWAIQEKELWFRERLQTRVKWMGFMDEI